MEGHGVTGGGRGGSAIRKNKKLPFRNRFHKIKVLIEIFLHVMQSNAFNICIGRDQRSKKKKKNQNFFNIFSNFDSSGNESMKPYTANGMTDDLRAREKENF